MKILYSYITKYDSNKYSIDLSKLITANTLEFVITRNMVVEFLEKDYAYFKKKQI